MSSPQSSSTGIALLPDRPSNRYEAAPLQAFTRLPSYTWLVVGVTCIGAFIGQLDASIVQLALPALERQFRSNLTTVGWVAIAYLLAFSVALPAFSRLSEMFGRKSLYITGYVVFTGASLMCGFASDLRHLIVYRLIQGVGGALLGANSLTILVKAAGPQKRGRAMGLAAAAQAVGISAGPVVGGLLLANLGWRWVFWVSVPFGIAGVIAGWLILPQTVEPSVDKRFDWWGVVLLTPALTSVVLLLSELHSWSPTSPALILTALTALVLFPCFVWWEHRAPSPLIDLHLFHIPEFSGGIVAVNLSYALLYAMFFLMSFAFLRGLNDSAVSAGLHLAVVPVFLGLMAPFSGALSERFGSRIMTTFGMAISLGAILLLGFHLAKGNELEILGALAVFGLGLGMFIAPNNSATIAAAPGNRSGEAGGLLNLMRVMGCMLGVATASTALSWRIQMLTGREGKTLGLLSHTVLVAVSGVFWVLAAFAIVAGIAALFRKPHQAKA